MSRFWPRCTWPVRFPEGRSIHARIETTPHMQIAQIQSGQLALEASWLPKAVKLLPVGVYLSGLRMRLPHPNAAPQRAWSHERHGKQKNAQRWAFTRY